MCTYLVDQDRQNSLLALHVRLMRIDCVPTLVSLTLADSHVGLKQKIGMAGVSVDGSDRAFMVASASLLGLRKNLANELVDCRERASRPCSCVVTVVSQAGFEKTVSAV